MFVDTSKISSATDFMGPYMVFKDPIRHGRMKTCKQEKVCVFTICNSFIFTVSITAEGAFSRPTRMRG